MNAGELRNMKGKCDNVDSVLDEFDDYKVTTGYDEMANFYAEKVKSALWILRYKYSNNVADLEKCNNLK
jgi:hypothetical protein